MRRTAPQRPKPEMHGRAKENQRRDSMEKIIVYSDFTTARDEWKEE